jgi:excisionase family DNA binding protein
VPLDSTRDTVLTPKQVADIFKVSPDTVAGWAENGKLAFFRTPGGHRRFRREDVEAFLSIDGNGVGGEAA